jgi:hypothetical protein
MKIIFMWVDLLMSKKYVIVAPGFNEHVGGNIALHKLCHILNEQGHQAYLCPIADDYLIRFNSFFKDFLKAVERKLRFHRRFHGLKISPRFNTPLLDLGAFSLNNEDYVVLYPETVCGNPLGAKNVVRWLLHQPGFHTGFVGYSSKELIFKFNNAIRDFFIFGSKTSENFLKIIDYPVDLYNQENCALERSGVAYCIRKGKNKKLNRHPDDAVLIDDLSHAEIASLFKRVKTFISYDDYTAYSLFAVLCGCDSVVVPSEGVNEKSWYPNVEDRYGIAYGFERLEWSKSTAHLQVARTFEEITKLNKTVQFFTQECESYFE